MSNLLRPLISKPPRCRWCGREPEFAHQEPSHEKTCLYCEALQEPILRLQNPLTGLGVQFWVNPDSGLFIEISKKSGVTDRYELGADALRKAGVLKTFQTGSLDGKKGGQ